MRAVVAEASCAADIGTANATPGGTSSSAIRIGTCCASRIQLKAGSRWPAACRARVVRSRSSMPADTLDQGHGHDRRDAARYLGLSSMVSARRLLQGGIRMKDDQRRRGRLPPSDCCSHVRHIQRQGQNALKSNEAAIRSKLSCVPSVRTSLASAKGLVRLPLRFLPRRLLSARLCQVGMPSGSPLKVFA